PYDDKTIKTVVITEPMLITEVFLNCLEPNLNINETHIKLIKATNKYLTQDNIITLSRYLYSNIFTITSVTTINATVTNRIIEKQTPKAIETKHCLIKLRVMVI